jgi:5-methylcytosine-specific restriction protein B
MNTADRSIGHIDYAIRRRFSFLSLKSDRNVISSYDKYDNGIKEKAENLFDDIKDFISSNINADLDAEDLMIGHSYFLCKTVDDLKMRLEFEMIPLIEEYEKDGIIMLEKSAMKTKFEEWKALL